MRWLLIVLLVVCVSCYHYPRYRTSQDGYYEEVKKQPSGYVVLQYYDSVSVVRLRGSQDTWLLIYYKKKKVASYKKH